MTEIKTCASCGLSEICKPPVSQVWCPNWKSRDEARSDIEQKEKERWERNREK